MSGSATKWLKDYYDGAQIALPNTGDFYRTTTMNQYYRHRTAGNNIPMVLGTHDLGAYYSIQNGFLLKFNRSLGNSDSVVNSVIGEGDGRTPLLNLMGVQYMFAKTDIIKRPQAVPYGFHFVKNNQGGILDFPELPVPGLSNHSGTVLLKSDLALPLVYMQNHVITAADYNSLSPLQREQALLSGAEVQKPVDGVSSTSLKPTVKTVGYTTQMYDQHLVNNPIKATLYRMRHSPNIRYRQAAAKFKTTLPANKIAIWEKATGLNPKGTPLKNIIAKNREVVERHEAENKNSLKIMDNDAQGHHLAYRLNLKDPNKYRNSELYLVIDGISETRHTMMDRLDNLRADSIVSGTPVSKLQKIDRLRAAAAFPDLGGYSISVQTGTTTAHVRQLPMNNLSDYEDRQHIVLNLGYTSKANRALILRFRGVKQLHFKSLKIMAVPFNRTYNRRINQLQQTGLQYQKVTNDTVSGYTDLTNHHRIMTTSIPYSTGWHLQIDGRNAETFRVNTGFVGAQVPEGRHFIKLKYKTPGFKPGILLSIAGVIWWVIFSLIYGITLLMRYRK